MAKRISREASAGQRQRLAQEAARLMVDHGIADFGLAKRKAAERFAVSGAGVLPSNAQIEACLVEHQRIFAPETRDYVDVLRRLAADVMDRLAMFQPRLVGTVLSGTVTVNTVVELHLFSDVPELVAAELEQQGINAGDCERRYRFDARKNSVPVPGFKFAVDGVQIRAMVFPEDGLRQAPLSAVDRRPMERAPLRKVLHLLTELEAQ
jgi:hypothetical protein